MANKYNVLRVDQAAEENNLSAEQTRALHCWVQDVGLSGDAWENGEINFELFEEQYFGLHDSFEAYANEYVESIGMLNDVPEEVARYFDYKSYADDLEHDYTVLEDDEGGVFVFLY